MPIAVVRRFLARAHVRPAVVLAAFALVLVTATASADHIAGQPCGDCASHQQWPRVTLDAVQKARDENTTFVGTDRSDELLGHHGSDKLYGKGDADILWGDWEGGSDQPTNQRDRIYGGPGDDFIYGSHGRNVIYAGPGNDAISVHFGRGFVDCGPGRDIYHVAGSRKDRYKTRNCEKVDYRSEAQRGGGLRPLP